MQILQTFDFSQALHFIEPYLSLCELLTLRTTSKEVAQIVYSLLDQRIARLSMQKFSGCSRKFFSLNRAMDSYITRSLATLLPKISPKMIQSPLRFFLQDHSLIREAISDSPLLPFSDGHQIGIVRLYLSDPFSPFYLRYRRDKDFFTLHTPRKTSQTIQGITGSSPIFHALPFSSLFEIVTCQETLSSEETAFSSASDYGILNAQICKKSSAGFAPNYQAHHNLLQDNQISHISGIESSDSKEFFYLTLEGNLGLFSFLNQQERKPLQHLYDLFPTTSFKFIDMIAISKELIVFHILSPKIEPNHPSLQGPNHFFYAYDPLLCTDPILFYSFYEPSSSSSVDIFATFHNGSHLVIENYTNPSTTLTLFQVHQKSIVYLHTYRMATQPNYIALEKEHLLLYYSTSLYPDQQVQMLVSSLAAPQEQKKFTHSLPNQRTLAFPCIVKQHLLLLISEKANSSHQGTSTHLWNTQWLSTPLSDATPDLIFSYPLLDG